MPAIEDHAYLKVCADLASCLSISIASARRRVDLVASREGVRDPGGRKAIAEKLLKEARSSNKSGNLSAAKEFDQLLEALDEEDNFMIED